MDGWSDSGTAYSKQRAYTEASREVLTIDVAEWMEEPAKLVFGLKMPIHDCTMACGSLCDMIRIWDASLEAVAVY
jgi:hypothetical protein